MSPLVRRVLAGTGANAFGQGVTILIQLASLPLFLSHWDLATYGVWLMLSAVPAYLGMADVGMVSAAGNRMTMAAGGGRWDEANRVFHSATWFVLLVCLAIAAVAAPLLMWAPLPGLTTDDRRMALLALTATVLIGQGGGLCDAVFKATGRYGVGTFYSNLVRLAEWGGSMLGLVWVGSFTAVALGALLVRLIGFFVMVMLSRSQSQGLRWSLRDGSVDELRVLARPALWFMVFPLANAMSLQSVTIVVGQTLGPAAAAVFNTCRTLARVTVQLTSVFSHAIGPELARLYGGGGAESLRHVYRRSLAVGSAFAVVCSAAVYVAAPWLLQVWTRGAVAFDASLVATFAIYAAVGGLWHVPRLLLFSTNHHAPLAAWYAVASFAALVFASVGATHWGLTGVALGVLAAELLIAGICVWLAQQAFAENVRMGEVLAR